MAAEISLSIDTTVKPCDDIYQHICGNFHKVHQIMPGQASVNAFSLINLKIRKELRILLEKQNLSNKDLPQTQAALYYRSCMDQLQRDKVSKRAIRVSLEAIKKKMTLDDALITNMAKGVPSRLIKVDVTVDSKNPQYLILKVGFPSLILSSNTLKSPENKVSKQQIAHYKKFMTTVLNIMHLWTDDRAIIDDIIALNIKVAKIIPSIPDQQNPDKSYNKISIGNLQKRCSEIKWEYIINRLLRDSGKRLTTKDEILVSSLPYIDGICKLIKLYETNDKLRSILYKDMVWAEIGSLASYGSKEMVRAKEELERNILGIKGQQERWQICVKYTASSLRDIMSNMYVKKYFDASMKKDIEKMAINIRNVMKDILENTTWMDTGTKKEALKKVKNIQEKIGYPDSILDENKLKEESKGLQFTINNFIDNFLLFKRWDFSSTMKYVNEKFPEDKWLVNPHQVNAYYAPWRNEIVFPAAILQYPFYDIGLPDASKYGGIGMVIGHEITHGFDTQGSKYDHKGVLREWWTKDTRKKYLEKAKCIQEQYGNYSIYGEQLQSQQTIGEDIADNAGIRMNYKALHNTKFDGYTLPGLNFTAEQLSFVQTAWIWCQSSSKESILELVKTNVHTVGKFRVIGSMSNMPEFSSAFKCTNEDKMMNRPNKCLVW